MPQHHEPYRNYVISQVPWLDSDWHPERCNACSHVVDHNNPPRFFYDIQDRWGTILNEDVGYCSRLCCRSEIDARMRENGEPSYADDVRLEMQEEATED